MSAGEQHDVVFQNWKNDVVSIENESAVAGEKRTKTHSDLQKEARIHFQSITSKHEEALAKLIRDLGPAFLSKNLPTRLRGLYVLFGAIEGCQDKKVSNSCLMLLGDFLTLQCGPIVDDDYEEDFDGMIRGVSIESLSALVGTPTTALIEDEKEFAEALQIRVDFAKKGVERRCAAVDDINMDDKMVTEEDDLYYKKDIRGGLSTLPRSKRSLCFSLLHRAVVGVSVVTQSVSLDLMQKMQKEKSEIISSIQSRFVQFADFAARCIHGESDPRCLQQLLDLLQSTQVAFCDWFQETAISNHNHVFPNEDFFDAVAPYYPIQFTPPPNNVHGITREGLHSALISVLSFTKMDGGTRRYHKPTMLGCSMSLFLEQLLPGQHDDENPTALEKLESLECTSALLFSSGKEGNNERPDCEGSECGNLTLEEVKTLSTALIATHNEASIGVNPAGGDLSDQNKVLAETCRRLAARVARELERPHKNRKSGLWEAFVSGPLDKELKKLKLTPAYAKTSIAYEASLATSGGPQTLRICLAKGLVPLLEFLQSHTEGEDDNALAAIHGIAAFVSSTQVAVSKSLDEGVELTPHPLETYATEIYDLLLKIVENTASSQSLSMKTAASSCLECMLFSTLGNDFESAELLKRIANSLNGLLKNTLGAKNDNLLVNESEYAHYQSVSSKSLGRILAASMGESDEGPKGPLSKSVLSVPIVQDCIHTAIFPELKAAAFASGKSHGGDRYDRSALSTACSSNKKLASAIVGAHLEAFLHILSDSIVSDASKACLEALSYILRTCAGNNAINAFHENDVVDDILDFLCNDLANSASAKLRDSISQVALPTAIQDQECISSKIDTVIAITQGLLPAFQGSVPPERLKKLLKAISDKIPPLSKADDYVLIVRLPILSAALQGAEPSLLEEVVGEIDGDEGLPVSQLLNDLTDYVLSHDHSSSARNAGALCIHALLKGGFNRNLDCPTKSLLVEINQRVFASSTNLTSTKNCLSYLSLLGSAAALRGSSSSSTANDIASFFMEVACQGHSEVPFSSDSENKVFNSSILFQEVHAQTVLSLLSASSYGAIMMEDEIKPLMKQRLTHNFIKYVKKISVGENVTNTPGIGLLMVVCHVVCASDLSRFDITTTHLLARLLVRGFSSQLFQPSSELGKKLPQEFAKSRAVAISALLKFLCTSPSAMKDHVLDLASGLLLSYAICDPVTEVGCKLITLQALQELSHLDGAKNSILTVKPAVISILSSAMTQKNGLLRGAAVDVRNVWCLIG